jgi:hypothetical protein
MSGEADLPANSNTSCAFDAPSMPRTDAAFTQDFFHRRLVAAQAAEHRRKGMPAASRTFSARHCASTTPESIDASCPDEAHIEDRRLRRTFRTS